jgi:uncharacterized cupredoxin-like copper-binding protein
MRYARFTRAAALVAAVAATWLPLATSAASSETVINVSLWDKGDTSMDNLDTVEPMGMAMTPKADMAKATMGIALDQASVPAGTVTFKVVNDSKGMIHEMILSPVADPATALPYSKEDMRIDEEGAGHLGEVAELDAKATGSLSIDLKPGTYILYCNIPGHYVLGMWTLLTVTG